MSFSPGGLAPRGPQTAEMSLWKINQLFFNRRGGGSVTPVNLTPPSIAVQGGGDATIGSVLEGTAGTWSGSPTLTYQWLREGVSIPGATNLSGYVVTTADRGTDITLAEIPNGVEASSVYSNAISVDPLAGLPFAGRWQTHDGDNVPVRMWQDVAMTVPAVNEFDPVAAWVAKDDSALILIQADVEKQPYLTFVGGVPVLFSDGFDDTMTTGAFPSAISQPNALFASASSANTFFNQILDGAGAGSQWLYFSGGGIYLYAGSTFIGGDAVSTNTWYTYSGVFNGASSAIRVDGGSPQTGNPGSDGLEGLYVGSLDGASRFFNGMISSVMIYQGLPSDSDRALIESYIQSISP